jgi:hypothetical protein
MVRSPLGVTIPQALLVQARTLTGIMVRDDETCARASAALVAAGHSKIKQRLVCDLTASGGNAMMAYSPLVYAEWFDLVDLITQDCYIAGCDGDAYYFNYILAEEARPLMGFVYQGRFYRYISLPFGLAPAPYLASTMSAEMTASITAQGAPCVAMIDDFMTAGASNDREDGLRKQAIMEGTLTRNGVQLAEAKRTFGQRAVFKGVLIDTVAMTVSVNPTSAGLFLPCLLSYRDTLAAGGDLPFPLWRHVCGKLKNYAELVQEGRLRVGSAWRYLRHGPDLWPHCRLKLISDLGY